MNTLFRTRHHLRRGGTMAIQPGESTQSAEDQVINQIENLVRSPNRIQLLRSIHDREPIEKDELRELHAMSRTTLLRNLEVLEGDGWIESPEPRTFTVSRSGELVTASISDLMEVVTLSNTLQPFLQWVPEGDFDLDLRLLDDAELIVGKPGDPWTMINHHVEALKSMNHCQGLLPFTGLHATEAATDRIIDSGARAELVVEPEVAATFRSESQYAELLRSAVETGRMDISVVDGSFPFGLFIIDETVQLIAAEGDKPRALLESESAEVREWAHSTFEAARRTAPPVEIPN